jgi:RNA polymerase sigma-70 factor, ECF subfamily
MPSATQTHVSLLERLDGGSDPVVWDEFFERYWPFLFSAARRRGCSEHTAEEVVQEVMLAIFERKAAFVHDPSRGRFRHWLAGVVRKKVAMRRRAPAERCRAQGGSGAEFPEPEDPNGALNAFDDAAFDQAMLAMLLDVVRREVHPRSYQAFEAFTLGGCSGAKAARLTGLTRNAVYQARKNIVRRLRELGANLGENGPPDEMIRAAIRARPSQSVERSLVTRFAEPPGNTN